MLGFYITKQIEHEMIVAQQDLHLYKQLVAGLLIYTLNFFHSMHRQSKLRRVIRAQVF